MSRSEEPGTILLVGSDFDRALLGDLVAVVEPDLARARASLLAGRPRLALVGPAPGAGIGLVGELVGAGCPVPLVLVLPGVDAQAEEAALQAGAALCLDPGRLRAGELGRLARFLCAGRTRAELHGARLQQALANYVAHEGKNALAGVRGAVQVVRDHLPLQAPDRVLCAEVLERLVTLTRTIEALTVLLRPPTPSPRSPVPLAELLHEALDRLASPAGPRLTVESEEVEVGGDRSQLALLLDAVLRGAIEAAGARGEVRVWLGGRDGDAVLEVSDTGPLVPAEELPRLLDLLGTTSGPRAGLGLPLARRLAEQHGGLLELRCADGAFGVRVRLPG